MVVRRSHARSPGEPRARSMRGQWPAHVLSFGRRTTVRDANRRLERARGWSRRRLRTVAGTRVGRDTGFRPGESGAHAVRGGRADRRDVGGGTAVPADVGLAGLRAQRRPVLLADGAGAGAGL